MRFRRGKEGEAANSPAPDAATRVEDPAEAISAPPPSGADRVEDPTADGPAKVLPPEAEASDAGPQSPAAADAGPQSPAAAAPSAAAPPSADTRVEAPGETEPAKVLPPPSETTRVEAPPPTAATRVDAPTPSAPPPQPGQLVSAAAPPTTGTVPCPQCGSPADPGQEMCIVCGSRIGRGPAGRQRGWLLPAVLAGLGVLLLGTAVGFGVVELTQDDEVKKSDVADLNENTQPTTPPATQPPAATPPADTAPTIPPASGGNTQPQDPNAQPDAPDTAPSTPPGSGGGEIAEWPAGKTAYTVVLVSATSRNAADAKAEQAVKRGIDAGVLRSDDFSTLRPGYWVVFAGQFDTSEQATRAADRYAEQGFGGGYPRQVKPK